MTWASRNAAAVHRATGEGGVLSLQPATTGASARTYADAKSEDRASWELRTGGALQEGVTRVITVPRSGTAPSEGEHATYDGGQAGIVKSVSSQLGYWTLGVTG